MAPKEVYVLDMACSLCYQEVLQHTCRRMLSRSSSLCKILHTHMSCFLTSVAVQARSLLSKVGGIVHHVHMEAGGRVSYKPYRDVSKVFIQRLRQFGGVGIIEKASIDEAYIQYAGKLEHQHSMTSMQQAEQLAQNIRHAGLVTAMHCCMPVTCLCASLATHHWQLPACDSHPGSTIHWLCMFGCTHSWIKTS